MKPTYREIRDVLDWLRDPDQDATRGKGCGTMIVTTKVTHGLIITIENYDKYQNPKSYERHNDGHDDGQGQRQNKDNKNDLKECLQERKRNNHNQPPTESQGSFELSTDETGGCGEDIFFELSENLSIEDVRRYIDLKVAHQEATDGFRKTKAAFRRHLEQLAKKGKLDTSDFDELLEWEQREVEARVWNEKRQRETEENNRIEAEQRRKRQAEEEEAKNTVNEHLAMLEKESEAPDEVLSTFMVSVLKGQYRFEGISIDTVLEVFKKVRPEHYRAAVDVHKNEVRRKIGLPALNIAPSNGHGERREAKPKEVQLSELRALYPDKFVEPT